MVFTYNIEKSWKEIHIISYVDKGVGKWLYDTLVVKWKIDMAGKESKLVGSIRT